MNAIMAMAIVLIMLAAAVRLTNRIIKAGVEKNAIVRWIMEKLGKAWWLVKLPVATGAIILTAAAPGP